MAQYRGFDLLDYLVVLVKYKKLFIILFFLLTVSGYLAVYFLIPPQYDSTAVLVVTEDSQLNPLNTIAGNFSSLPLDMLGFSGVTSFDRYNLFTTIIYSRSNLEDMMKRFDLKKDYGVEKTEDMVKLLRDLIEVNITDELAYEISVRASSPEKAAEMTNYLLQKVNNTVIDLNTKKARENRLFLEERYHEIMTNVTLAEDSLRRFQEKSGILEAENQTKAILEVYAKLEAELGVKQVELAVTEQIFGMSSPQAENMRITVNDYKNKIDNYANGSSKENVLLPLKRLPKDVVQYYRYFRNVEIYNAMLEFIIPLYEQSRFEEVKAVPVLQIIDKAVPPEKKSYPPRTLFALIITFIILFIISSIIFIKEWLNSTDNERVKLISSELMRFRRKQI
jgi:uncharacterized protein involved in exopolysaccharide biosynthesis